MSLVMTATLTGVGLGSGFGIAQMMRELSWGPMGDIVAAEWREISRELYIAIAQNDELLKKVAWNQQIMILASRPWVPYQGMKYLISDCLM